MSGLPPFPTGCFWFLYRPRRRGRPLYRSELLINVLCVAVFWTAVILGLLYVNLRWLWLTITAVTFAGWVTNGILANRRYRDSN